MISLKSSKKKLRLEPRKPKVLVILGPTASGKSDLAVKLARKFNGEVISADSRQVYKGLDIGSGKITKREMMGVPHYLLSVASPKGLFTAERYRRLGKAAIKKILAKDRLPIICGGTGLYIDTLMYDYNFPKVPPQKALRAKLEKLSTAKLFEKLIKQAKGIDSTTAKRIDKHNRRRLIRALEIISFTGKPIPPIEKSSPYDVTKIGIKIAPEQLKKNIEKRLTNRLKIGMVGEVRRLHANGLSWKRLYDLGLEYRYISRYLRGLISLDQMKADILHESYQYAKRQMTWFKRDQSIIWIAPSGKAGARLRGFLFP